MSIHKEGHASIVISLLLVIILSYNTFTIFPEDYILFSLPLYAIYLGFWLFIISFFRYPKRTVNTGENKILAPADGTDGGVELVCLKVTAASAEVQINYGFWKRS